MNKDFTVGARRIDKAIKKVLRASESSKKARMAAGSALSRTRIKGAPKAGSIPARLIRKAVREVAQERLPEQ